MGDDELVELADAIEVVREQLVTAQQVGRQTVAGQLLTFAVGKVSIEFSGEVKRVTGVGGGLKFWVLTADANTERSRTGTHKVTIELIPEGPGRTSYKVAGGVNSPPSGPSATSG